MVESMKIGESDGFKEERKTLEGKYLIHEFLIGHNQIKWDVII